MAQNIALLLQQLKAELKQELKQEIMRELPGIIAQEIARNPGLQKQNNELMVLSTQQIAVVSNEVSRTVLARIGQVIVPQITSLNKKVAELSTSGEDILNDHRKELMNGMKHGGTYF